jgi:hypothetical protein
MEFRTPSGLLFDIPDEWWVCTDMDRFSRGESQFWAGSQNVQIVPLAEVEPPSGDAGIPPFKKYKLIPVLFGFQSPESSLPPVHVLLKNFPGPYRFKVYDGYHRYYASVAAGYPNLPVVLMESVP